MNRLAVDKLGLRMIPQIIHFVPDFIFLVDIVIIKEADQLALCFLNAEVTRAGSRQHGIRPDDQAGMPGLNISRSYGFIGTVIDYDNLDGIVCLSIHALHCSVKQSNSMAGRNNNRHEWCIHS